MNIKISAAVLLGTLAAPAFAMDYRDSAPVVASVPVYQTLSEPQQQCWTESVTSYEQRRSAGGIVLGGVTGGLLGNTIGRGNGRVASTVVGAVIGAAVGDHLANRDNVTVAVTRPVQRCQTVQSYRQVLTGYQVTYNYNGRNTTILMPYDPGPSVPVEVAVAGHAAEPVIVNAPVTYIAYERPVQPVWGHKPLKHHHHDRDRDWDR
jgi:uncharacterized protein YcfJ